MRPLGLAVLLTMTLLTAAAQAETLDSEEHALWTLINDYRQANSVQKVGLNDHLMAAAEWMSEDMAANDRYSHIDSQGRSWPQRMADFGYGYNTATGEVLAAGRDAQGAFDAWKDSPEHDAIMLGSFWAVGIARVYDEASTHGWYWTVDFGGRGPAWFPPTPTPVLSATATPTLTLVSVPVATPVPMVAPTPTPSPTPSLTPNPAELPSTGTKPN